MALLRPPPRCRAHRGRRSAESTARTRTGAIGKHAKPVPPRRARASSPVTRGSRGSRTLPRGARSLRSRGWMGGASHAGEEIRGMPWKFEGVWRGEAALGSGVVAAMMWRRGGVTIGRSRRLRVDGERTRCGSDVVRGMPGRPGVLSCCVVSCRAAAHGPAHPGTAGGATASSRGRGPGRSARGAIGSFWQTTIGSVPRWAWSGACFHSRMTPRSGGNSKNSAAR